MTINTVSDLLYAPTLRKLLVNYVLRMYEGDADTSDDALLKEYIYLRDNNRLQELFEEEALSNKIKEDFGIEDFGIPIDEILINPKVKVVFYINHLDSTDDEDFFDDEDDSENHLQEPDDDIEADAKEETPIPDTKTIKTLLLPMEQEPDDKSDDESDDE